MFNTAWTVTMLSKYQCQIKSVQRIILHRYKHRWIPISVWCMQYIMCSAIVHGFYYWYFGTEFQMQHVNHHYCIWSAVVWLDNSVNSLHCKYTIFTGNAVELQYILPYAVDANGMSCPAGWIFHKVLPKRWA